MKNLLPVIVMMALVTNWNSSFLDSAMLKGNWLFKIHSLKLLSNQNLMSNAGQVTKLWKRLFGD